MAPRFEQPERQFPVKLVAVGLTVLFSLIMVFMMIGVNSNGYRTVIQTGTGATHVKFNSGPYLVWFGTTTVYPDFITFDFDKNQENDEARSINQHGVNVRYQEGGTGTVFGQARFALPNDEQSMLALHRAYRSPEGVAFKLIKTSTEEVINMTANLMTSDESYTEKRNIYPEWAREQLQSGKFRTRLEMKEVTEEGTDRKVTKNVPVIAKGTDGLPLHSNSDLKQFNVSLATIQLVDWDYEAKTLEQIQARRAATMAIITAKAEAERAKQDAITAEENGKRDVMKAKYEKEVEKSRAVVDAERAKEVAEIAAKQRVSVAEQEKLEQEQKKLAMNEYKQAETLRGEGDASYKKAVIEADGALAQKLATYETVMAKFATEFGKQKWVPDIQLGASPGGTVNQAQTMLDLLTTKAAKDLSLDLNVNTKAVAK